MAAKTLSSIVGGTIKSVQRGLKAASGTTTVLNQTITAVDLDKSFVVHSPDFASTTYNAFSATLTSTTNLRFERGSTTSMNMSMKWEVIEYE